MPTTMTHTDASMQLALNPALLTVHNRRADGAPVQLVLFKRNTAANEYGQPIAWKVTRCTAAQPVCLNYPFTHQLAAFDPQGAHVGLLDAVAGERFRIAGEGSLLREQDRPGPDQAAAANVVAVQNDTADARLDVLVYKDGRPLCRQSLLAPGAAARFELLPVIYAAVVQGSGRAGEGLVEGGLVDAASAASAVRLSMLGLVSADLLIESDGGQTGMRLAKLRFA